MAVDETASRMMQPATDPMLAADMAELRERRRRETDQLKADCKEVSDRLDAMQDDLDKTFKAIGARLDKLDGGSKAAEKGEAGSGKPGETKGETRRKSLFS